MRSPAFIAGDPFLEAGIGYHFREIKTNAWVGLGMHPYFNESQIAGELECERTSALHVKGTFNYGLRDNAEQGDVPEYGFSGGLRIRF